MLGKYKSVGKSPQSTTVKQDKSDFPEVPILSFTLKASLKGNVILRLEFSVKSVTGNTGDEIPHAFFLLLLHISSQMELN